MDIAKLDKSMANKEVEQELIWYDASQFTIEGKGWTDTKETYSRLPTKAEKTVRAPVWELAGHSAGISIRFTTNSPTLGIKWDGNKTMDHMTAIGVSGLDLYVKHEDKWKFLSVARPSQAENQVGLFADLEIKSREYMLNLPLYNSVHKIELGIIKSSEINATVPRVGKPIVFYGTSITQGGCASRPGMCYTSILSRWLDRPCINLGFSGNGNMDPEVIDLLCELDAAVFVLDNIPNMNKKQIEEREENAIRKLRKAHPDVPILLVDSMNYTDSYLIISRYERYDTSNKAQLVVFEKLIAEGFQNLYHLLDDSLIGSDGEATVDGTHFTDLGFMRFSEKIFLQLKELI